MKRVKKIPVLKLTIEGVFIEKYDSINVAAKENNISACSISNVLAKREKSSGGFLWKYEEGYNPPKKSMKYSFFFD